MISNGIKWPTLEEVEKASVDEITSWVMTLPQPVTEEQEKIAIEINRQYIDLNR
jgi:hypothetical protein